MKRIFTLAFLIAVAIGVQAQTNIYTANFSSGIGSWTTVDNTGTTAGVWQYKNNPVTVPSGGTLNFASATASNGYMLFMSDAATNDNKPEDADLLSPAVNCSAHNFVFLEFDHYFRQVSGSSGSVFVSNNGSTWNQVFAVSTTSSNPKHTVLDITQFVANQATVYLKFNYQGDWDYYWAVDDIKLVVPAALDISVDTITMSKYVGISSQTVSGTVTNRGGTTINSFDLGYSDNGGASVYQNFMGLSIAPLASQPFSFNTPLVMNTAIQHDIIVTAYSPNSGADLVASNDSRTQKVITLSAVPVRNVLLEEFTTAPCQFCPDAGSRLVDIIDRNPYMILASLHAGFGTDAMTIADHSTVATQYTTSAPAVMVDRVYYDSEGGADIGFYNDPYDRWEPYAQTRKTVTTPVSIIADNTYNSTTRQLTVNASAKFYSVITDNFRLNCYIIEDSVSGTGSGYNQQNAYNNDASSPWYQKGSPIIGFQHRHVVRQMLGGAWGSLGSIDATTADGGVYNKQYTYTLPATWDESQVTVVVLAQHYHASNKFDRQILNAMELHLNSADSTGVVSSINDTKVTTVNSIGLFPNPTSGIININYSLNAAANIGFEMFNVIGQSVHTVASDKLNKGDYRTQINTADFSNGVYFVAVKDGNKVVQTLRFIVNK